MPARRRAYVFVLLQQKFFKQQYPNKVYPAEHDTENGNDNAHDKPYQAALFKESWPSYDDFNYPVYAGDKQQQNLHQAALSVKPSHVLSPYNKFIRAARARPAPHVSKSFTPILYHTLQISQRVYQK